MNCYVFIQKWVSSFNFLTFLLAWTGPKKIKRSGMELHAAGALLSVLIIHIIQTIIYGPLLSSVLLFHWRTADCPVPTYLKLSWSVSIRLDFSKFWKKRWNYMSITEKRRVPSITGCYSSFWVSNSTPIHNWKKNFIFDMTLKIRITWVVIQLLLLKIILFQINLLLIFNQIMSNMLIVNTI